jgi:hypothetical protein
MPAKPRNPRTRARSAKRHAQPPVSQISRAAFDRVVARVNDGGEMIKQHGNALERMRRDLDIQFKRIAELQAELDGIKKTSAKANLG